MTNLYIPLYYLLLWWVAFWVLMVPFFDTVLTANVLIRAIATHFDKL